MAEHGRETDTERVAGSDAQGAANDNEKLMRRIEMLEDEISGLEVRIDNLRGRLYEIANSNRSDEEDLAMWAESALQEDDKL
jgi:hypothetical protein